jgi:holliday junction DNA helicase RuvA
VIARLSGHVEEKTLDGAVIDVSGVGYRVYLSQRTLTKLPPAGSAVVVRVQTVVREDALDLYGFLSESEEQMFLLLTSVTHVGPRGAMNILSGAAPEDLARTITSRDLARLTKLPGVGKKTAERLLVELKDKVGDIFGRVAAASAGATSVGHRADVVSALVGMGYKPAQAEHAALVAEERLGPAASLDALVTEALRAAR